MALIGKQALDIQKQIDSLNKFNVPKEEFGDSYQQALDSVQTVLTQLGTMLTQQITLEKHSQDNEPSQPVAEKPADCATSVITAGDKETQTEHTATDEIITLFLHAQTDVTDFGFLLVTDDPQLNAEALRNLKSKFHKFLGDRDEINTAL